MDAFGVRILDGEVAPLVKAEGIERAVLGAQDNLGMALEEQSEGTTGGAYVDRLPQSVEYQHMLV